MISKPKIHKMTTEAKVRPRSDVHRAGATTWKGQRVRRHHHRQVLACASSTNQTTSPGSKCHVNTHLSTRCDESGSSVGRYDRMCDSSANPLARVAEESRDDWGCMGHALVLLGMVMDKRSEKVVESKTPSKRQRVLCLSAFRNTNGKKGAQKSKEHTRLPLNMLLAW